MTSNTTSVNPKATSVIIEKNQSRTKRIIPSDRPDTIADGLLTSLGAHTFSVLRELLADIVRVPDERTIEAMRLIWERMKILVEPSSAVPLGAVLENAAHARLARQEGLAEVRHHAQRVARNQGGVSRRLSLLGHRDHGGAKSV